MNPFWSIGFDLLTWDFVAPRVGRLVADELLRPVDCQQGAVGGDFPGEGGAGEDFRQQVAGRAVHDRVGGGDDDVVAAADIGFQGQAAGGGDVADVDVAPQI